MADQTLETKRLDTPEQFEAQTGYKPTVEFWKPINTTPAKLAELKDSIGPLSPTDKAARTRDFIEANKASDVPVQRAPEMIAPAVAIATATTSVGTEVGSMLSDMAKEATSELKKPGFWKEKMGGFMKDAVEAMLEAKKEGGVMGFFAWLLLGMFKPWMKKLGLSADQLKELGVEVPATAWAPVNPEPTPWTKPAEAIKKTAETSKDTAVTTLTSNYFFRKAQTRDYNWLWTAVWEGTKDATVNRDEKKARVDIEAEWKRILGYAAVGKLSFRQIVAEKDNADIAKKLWITGLNKETQIPALQLAAKVLSANEAWIDDMLKNTAHPNWRDISMAEFLSNYYQYTWMATLWAITDKISKIDIKDPAAYADAIRSVAISRWTDGSMSGYVGDKLKSYEQEWIDSEVISRIVLGNIWDQSVSNFRSALTSNGFKNPLAQAKMTEITTKDWFPKWVVKLMKEIWLDSYTESLNNGEWLEMEELLMVYVITGGVDNIGTLTQWQRNELIPVLYTIAGRSSPAMFALDQTTSLIWWMQKNQYVKQMSDFVGEAISDAAYTATFTGIGFSIDSVNAIMSLRTDPDPEKQERFLLIVGILWLGIGSMVYFRKPVLSIALMVWLIQAVVGIGVLQTVSK